MYVCVGCVTMDIVCAVYSVGPPEIVDPLIYDGFVEELVEVLEIKGMDIMVSLHTISVGGVDIHCAGDQGCSAAYSHCYYSFGERPEVGHMVGDEMVGMHVCAGWLLSLRPLEQPPTMAFCLPWSGIVWLCSLPANPQHWRSQTFLSALPLPSSPSSTIWPRMKLVSAQGGCVASADCAVCRWGCLGDEWDNGVFAPGVGMESI